MRLADLLTAACGNPHLGQWPSAFLHDRGIAIAGRFKLDITEKDFQ
jgi:hypothetical protein